MFCGCGGISLKTSGGVTAGGSAIVSLWSIGGGATAGGSANVSTNKKNDMFAAWYWLDELAYIDHSPNQLHGDGSSVISSGVACMSSQGFNIDEDNQHYAAIPFDGLTNQPFSVSMWVNLVDDFKVRTLFSRGNDLNGQRCSFHIYHSYINHIVASVNQPDGSLVDVYSGIIDTDRWYHVAVNYTGSDLEVYVNGTLEGTEPATIIDTTNGGFIGAKNFASQPSAYIQDVRIYPEAKSNDWWETEFLNYCSSDFVSVGSPAEL